MFDHFTYDGAPDECSKCWPHKDHEGDTCAACGPDDLGDCVDLGCRYLFRQKGGSDA